MLVAAAARTARRDHDARSGVHEVGHQLLTVEDLCPDRHAQHCVVAAGAVREPAAPDSASARTELLVRAEAREIAPSCVRHEDDVPSVASVSTVGAAARDVLLAPEVDRAVT